MVDDRWLQEAELKNSNIKVIEHMLEDAEWLQDHHDCSLTEEDSCETCERLYTIKNILKNWLKILYETNK